MDDPDDSDSVSDIAAPNPRAQYRGFQMVLVLVLVSGVVALVLGADQSAQNIAAAFPTRDALLQGAAWMRFLQSLGQLTAIGLIVIAAALFLRWRLRRRRA